MNRNSGNVRRKSTPLNYFRIGETVNLDEIRNWVENTNKHNFTDHFMVDEHDLIKKNGSGKANEQVMDNHIIICDEQGNYSLISEENFTEQYEEYSTEEKKEEEKV